MGYVAAQPLRWGEDTIAPGDPVPAGEDGRDYAGMLHLGLIREVSDSADLPDDAVRRKLDAAEKRVKELEAQVAAGTGGESEDGPRLVLADEEKQLLASKGLEGEFTLDELDAALTADGDETEGTGDALPEGVTAKPGGWFELPDGSKVRGREALDAALTAAEAE
jgi:hypothetical protein